MPHIAFASESHLSKFSSIPSCGLAQGSSSKKFFVPNLTSACSFSFSSYSRTTSHSSMASSLFSCHKCLSKPLPHPSLHHARAFFIFVCYVRPHSSDRHDAYIIGIDSKPQCCLQQFFWDGLLLGTTKSTDLNGFSDCLRGLVLVKRAHLPHQTKDLLPHFFIIWVHL